MFRRDHRVTVENFELQTVGPDRLLNRRGQGRFFRVQLHGDINRHARGGQGVDVERDWATG